MSDMSKYSSMILRDPSRGAMVIPSMCKPQEYKYKWRPKALLDLLLIILLWVVLPLTTPITLGILLGKEILINQLWYIAYLVSLAPAFLAGWCISDVISGIKWYDAIEIIKK